eukprot:3944422-Heterocapsa_arctica.AAC.1
MRSRGSTSVKREAQKALYGLREASRWSSGMTGVLKASRVPGRQRQEPDDQVEGARGAVSWGARGSAGDGVPSV